jgi:hypothetical protein
MEPLILRANERGIYSMLAAFLFIVVVLAVVFGLIYLRNTALVVENKIADSINDLEIADDVREAIKYYYGDPICEADLYAGKQPNVPLIKGFKIENYGLMNCTARVWAFNETQRCDQRFVYIINTKPATYDENNLGTCETTDEVCLSKLEICL